MGNGHRRLSLIVPLRIKFGDNGDLAKTILQKWRGEGNCHENNGGKLIW
jgi:hypothetical protein